MPRAGSGSSAKAKANAGGNKKAKAASTQKKTKAKAGGKQASTLAAVSGPDLSQMKRRLDRRDTDEQAARAMEAKFYEQGYSQTVVESLRNSWGESIQDVVSEEIRMMRGKKNISPQLSGVVCTQSLSLRRVCLGNSLNNLSICAQMNWKNPCCLLTTKT